MKRRNVLKTLSLLPLAGSAIPFNSSFASPLDGKLTAAPFNTGRPVEVTLESFLDKNNIYRRHGIEPVINCRGIFTIIGGSLKRAQV
jgi:D-glucosaminate-6-phosphate ammonia-lyase